MGKTHSITQLLLLQNRPEEAVRVAMEQGGLSQAQVVGLADFMSYDAVGSFLIALKGIQEKETNALINKKMCNG